MKQGNLKDEQHAGNLSDGRHEKRLASWAGTYTAPVYVRVNTSTLIKLMSSVDSAKSRDIQCLQAFYSVK